LQNQNHFSFCIWHFSILNFHSLGVDQIEISNVETFSLARD